MRASVPKAWYQGKSKKGDKRGRVGEVDVDPFDVVVPTAAGDAPAPVVGGEASTAAVGTPGGTVHSPADVADPTDSRGKNVRWFKWLLTQIPTVLTPMFQGKFFWEIGGYSVCMMA